MDLRLVETVSFYLLHNVSTLNQCREVSCVTFVCKHFASSPLSTCILYCCLQRVTIREAVVIQLVLLMMSSVLLETCCSVTYVLLKIKRIVH